MIKEKRHGDDAEIVSLCYLQCIQTIGGHGLVDKVSFSIFYFVLCQAFVVSDFVMAIVAENDQIVVIVVGPVAINVMLRKDINTSGATNSTGVIGLEVN